MAKKVVTFFGDFNMVAIAEVEKLMGGDVSGRVSC